MTGETLDTEPHLVPAVAVVDSRNVWGAAIRHFGSGRTARVDGVRDALRNYGFDVQRVYVGIATTTTTPRPSQRLKDALTQNLRYATSVEGDALGEVLHGRLVERRQELEEKLVDVLCAMQIARSAHEISAGRSDAEAIVVLSEDMDLIPAYQFAQDLGVPIFAAACATVDTRSSDASWILLGEGSMRSVCERPQGRSVGQELRFEVCRWLTADSPRRVQFRVVAEERGNKRVRLRHNSGAIGFWYSPPPEASVRRGEAHELEVVGLAPCSSERDFPYLLLAPPSDGRPWPPEHVTRGTVESWSTPTRVRVALHSGATRTLTASPGTLLPGDEVLIHEDRSQPQTSWRLIGRSRSARLVPFWDDPTVPLLVRVKDTGPSPGARVRATICGTEREVTVQPPGQERPERGTIYAVVPTDVIPLPDGSQHVMTIAVSLCVRLT